MRYTRKWVCRCGSVPVYQWRTGGEISTQRKVSHMPIRNEKREMKRGKCQEKEKQKIKTNNNKDSGQRHMGTKATSVLLLR